MISHRGINILVMEIEQGKIQLESDVNLLKKDKETLAFLEEYLVKWDKCVQEGLKDVAIPIPQKIDMINQLTDFIEIKSNYLYSHLDTIKAKIIVNPMLSMDATLLDDYSNILESLRNLVQLAKCQTYIADEEEYHE